MNDSAEIVIWIILWYIVDASECEVASEKSIVLHFGNNFWTNEGILLKLCTDIRKLGRNSLIIK
jgi:hypothetical protein